MDWLEIKVTCGRQAAEAAAAILHEVTGRGVAIEDPWGAQQNPPPGIWDYSELPAGDPDTVTVTGYLPAEAWEEALAQARERLAELAGYGLGPVGAPEVRWRDESEWADTWKQYFKPLRVGKKLVVIPPWHTYDLALDDVPLYLDPGMAFGTGTHATTQLCLEALEEWLRPGMTVLDVGTGSGILAIAALRLGAGRTEALDLDPVAVKAAQQNAERNGLQLPVLHGELGDWQEANPGQQADIVVANLVADLIIALAVPLAAVTAPGGHVIVGGILAERTGPVQEALTAAGLALREQRARDGWAAIVATRPQPGEMQ